MKKIMVLTLFSLTSMFGYAQSGNQVKMTYKYDNNGNVTSRTVFNTQGIGGGTLPRDTVGWDVSIKDGNGVYTINVKGNGDNAVGVDLYDTASQLVRSETFKGTTHTVDLRQNADGVYIFEVKFADNVYSQKVLKH